MGRFTILILLIISIFIEKSGAQQFTNAYTDKSTTSVIHPLFRIATDGMGNVINGSSFSGVLTVGSVTHAANGNLGAYMVKRDANDSVLWSRSLTCGSVVTMGDIYCDHDNNIYVTGMFGTNTIPSYSTTLNCVPFPLTIPSGASAFIIKYAPDGSVIWSRSVPVAAGTHFVNSDLFRISGNGTDRIAVSAPMSGIANTNIGGIILDSTICNLFFAISDSAGNWLHAAPVCAPGTTHIGLSLSMASDGNLYLSGSANGTLTFGAAGSLVTGGLRDYVVKVNNSGAYIWYRAPIGASSWWRTEALADNNGVFLIGSFSGSAQLGTTNLTSGTFATYMARLDASGNWINAAKFGTGEARMYAACRNANSIFISGYTDSNPGVTSNTFGTFLMDYTASLSASVIQSNDMSYIIEVDTFFQVQQGAVFANSFATLNVSGMAASGNEVFLTGPATGSAYFASFLVNGPQVNTCNYVAKYSSEANIITGKCFYDFNANGTLDANDVYSGNWVSIQSPSITRNVFANGSYTVGVDDGVNYTISIPYPPLYYTYTPSNHSAFFPTGTSNQVDSLNDFALQPVPNQNDLVIDLSVGAMRPGFSGTAIVTLRNMGTTPKSGNIDLLFNSIDLNIDSVIPSASSINNNAAVFNYNLTPTQQQTWWVNYTLSVNAVLGTTIQCIATAADPTDLTPSNNADTVLSPVTGSYDPNNKTVSPEGDLSVNTVAAGLDLKYTINFQNTGSDTAFTVVITDTMSTLLDLTTFELLSSSHPVVINLQGRQIWFRFYNINLPDSNVNELLSHGNIRYRIRPLNTCQPGDIISNTASIYFDFNQPVITNTTNNEVVLPASVEEIKSSSLYVFPNPATGGFVSIVADHPIESITIWDITGRKVVSKIVNGVNSYTLDIRGFKQGTYLIRAVTKNHVFSTVFTK